jgi:uncharacterized protein
MDKDTARSKKENLVRMLKGLRSLLIAFSGGVDSSFLLALAHQYLGDKVTAATGNSPIFPSREQDSAAQFTRQRGIKHIVFQTTETGLPEFISNPPDRCYHCKRALSRSLVEIAEKRDIAHIAHAANLDDLSDYRPGMRAAQEMGLLSPLLDSNLRKDEIRFLSREMGLPTWDKPSMPCLVSRIPYWSIITKQKLAMIEEAENFLSDNGFRQFRVRHHGPVARLEMDQKGINRLLKGDLRNNVVKRLKEIGFSYVSIDLEGYVSGSMNRYLDDKG